MARLQSNQELRRKISEDTANRRVNNTKRLKKFGVDPSRLGRPSPSQKHLGFEDDDGGESSGSKDATSAMIMITGLFIAGASVSGLMYLFWLIATGQLN